MAAVAVAVTVVTGRAATDAVMLVRVARRAVRRATLLLSCKFARWDAMRGLVFGLRVWYADPSSTTAVAVSVVAVAAVVRPLPRKVEGG